MKSPEYGLLFRSKRLESGARVTLYLQDPRCLKIRRILVRSRGLTIHQMMIGPAKIFVDDVSAPGVFFSVDSPLTPNAFPAVRPHETIQITVSYRGRGPSTPRIWLILDAAIGTDQKVRFFSNYCLPRKPVPR